MKKKYLALFALAAAALTGTASAQTVIRLTGSTAFRGATITGIRNILAPGYTYAYIGANVTGATEAIFTGTTLQTAGPPASPATSVVIKVSWGGSTGGLRTVVTNQTVARWLKSSTTASTGGTAYANDAAVIAAHGGAPYEPFDPAVTADVTMADTFQSSTDFKSPVLTGIRVGTIVFQWVRNNGSPVSIRNMTPWLATNILSGGTPLSLFTGLPADRNTMVRATGRDEESGTRTATFAECLFGSSSNPTQYQVIGNPVTDLIPWPRIPLIGDPEIWPEGHSGYLGGSNLVTALNTPGSATNPNNPAHLVSYAGINDAATVNPGVVATANASVPVTPGPVTAITLAAPGFGGTNYGPGTFIVLSGGGGTGAAATPVIDPVTGVISSVTVTSGGSGYTGAPTVAFRGGATLTWNGVAYSPTAVLEGQYTYWSYQILYFRPGYAELEIATQIAARIRDFDATVSGTKLSDMKVERTVEGGDVTPL